MEADGQLLAPLTLSTFTCLPFPCLLLLSLLIPSFAFFTLLLSSMSAFPFPFPAFSSLYAYLHKLVSQAPLLSYTTFSRTYSPFPPSLPPSTSVAFVALSSTANGLPLLRSSFTFTIPLCSSYPSLHLTTVCSPSSSPNVTHSLSLDVLLPLIFLRFLLSVLLPYVSLALVSYFLYLFVCLSVCLSLGVLL